MVWKFVVPVFLTKNFERHKIKAMSGDNAWTASFQYAELALVSLLPLQLVLIAFGGRIFINIAGIGLGLAYIFDIIGIGI